MDAERIPHPTAALEHGDVRPSRVCTSLDGPRDPAVREAEDAGAQGRFRLPYSRNGLGTGWDNSEVAGGSDQRWNIERAFKVPAPADHLS